MNRVLITLMCTTATCIALLPSMAATKSQVTPQPTSNAQVTVNAAQAANEVTSTYTPDINKAVYKPNDRSPMINDLVYRPAGDKLSVKNPVFNPDQDKLIVSDITSHQLHVDSQTKPAK